MWVEFPVANSPNCPVPLVSANVTTAPRFSCHRVATLFSMAMFGAASADTNLDALAALFKYTDGSSWIKCVTCGALWTNVCCL